MDRQDDNRPKLSEEVLGLVEKNGGWLNVIPRLTSSFDDALKNHGHLVNCPFPHRHRNGGGKDDFRFSNKPGYEDRAICSCLQDGGRGPIELLILDGVGRNYTDIMFKVRDALTAGNNHTRKVTPIVANTSRGISPEDEQKRKAKHLQTVRGLIELSDPAAEPGRLYFQNRGIPLNSNIGDVKFHPALEYYETRMKEGVKVKELIGRFPAIVSAFRSRTGRVVNVHKIYLTQDGRKLDCVSKVKKIDSPLSGFKGSSIRVAHVEGCRTLHVTEGVEKGWSIHLATGESVRVAHACTTLATLFVDRAEFNRVVIWSDNDPFNEARGKHGDGQTFAWKLFVELTRKGFEVAFMLPDVIHTPGAKGQDWEDIIVEGKVLEHPLSARFQLLRAKACEGGIFVGYRTVEAAELVKACA
ncbi:TPA: toprim domain-containing protein [Pseudomonas aeruginosa]